MVKVGFPFTMTREGARHLELPGKAMRNVKNILVSSAVIAIVDDDKGVRSGLSNLLKSAGYDTVGFSSSEDFLAFADIDSLRCAILDVQLSGMDGLDLQEQLIARKISVPVIFLSAHGFEEVRARAKKNGAVAFLQKPVNTDTLIACILRIVEAGKDTL